MIRNSLPILALSLTLVFPLASGAEDPSAAKATNVLTEVEISEFDLRAIQADAAKAEWRRQEETWTRHNRQEGQGVRSGNVRVRMLASEQQKLLDESKLIQEALADLDNEAWPSLRERLLEKQKEYDEAWQRMKELEEQEARARQTHEQRRRQRTAVWTTTIQK